MGGGGAPRLLFYHLFHSHIRGSPSHGQGDFV